MIKKFSRWGAIKVFRARNPFPEGLATCWVKLSMRVVVLSIPTRLIPHDMTTGHFWSVRKKKFEDYDTVFQNYRSQSSFCRWIFISSDCFLVSLCVQDFLSLIPSLLFSSTDAWGLLFCAHCSSRLMVTLVTWWLQKHRKWSPVTLLLLWRKCASSGSSWYIMSLASCSLI